MTNAEPSVIQSSSQLFRSRTKVEKLQPFKTVFSANCYLTTISSTNTHDPPPVDG